MVTSSFWSSGVRAPSWSRPGPMRPAKCGIMLPPWWMRNLSRGWRSSTPERTIRPMKIAVSYSQPNTHHSSYFERSSVG